MKIKNINVEISAVSHTGKIRNNNEDNLYLDGIIIDGAEQYFEKSILTDKSNLTLAVFDGVGGVKAGEIASFSAAMLLKEYLDKNNHDAQDINAEIEQINEYAEAANNHVYLLSENNPKYKDMATTFACLIVSYNMAVSINLGDSRIYFFRNKSLQQISVDHTEAERLVRLGIINREDLKDNPYRNLISRCIGMPPDYGNIETDISNIIIIKSKDLFLLCTDGLTDMLNDNEIEKILFHGLNNKLDSKSICSRLLEEALDKGGRDNITIIIAKVL